MPAAITVHPLVLLSVVDHVTRVGLQHQQQLQSQERGNTPDVAAASPPAPAFLSTAGLLMGTTKASGPSEASTCGAGGSSRVITTTLSASFELPLRLQPTDGVAVNVAASGDATFLERVLSDETDWPGAQKHREQLNAVMPELDVVGCYVVCAGSRWTSATHRRGGDDGDGFPLSIESAVKKAKGEAIGDVGGIVAIANCVQQLLRSTELLPPTATGFVLLVVYDKEVTSAASETGTAAPSLPQSPVAVRLPFDCFYVSATTVSDALSSEEVEVGPADMEWIALANETVTPPRRQGSTAISSAAHAPAARETTNTRTPSMASPQNSSAAEELVGSLRLVMRLLVKMTESTLSTTATVPGDVELLRTVATCLRNVPDSRPSSSSGDSTALCALQTEEVLSAVLALEVQCALHLRSLSKAQQLLLGSNRPAMEALHSTTRPPKAATAPPPDAKEGRPTHGRDKRSGVPTAALGHVRE
ncbi:hypothetical protein Q4I28_001534 [Leishmania naiffi]|uniref:Uncharacterized protein n=1 Tax=Leishmania naiffi TaxID=5678 RepID=A0AAW3C3B5_9TRYP